MHTDLSVPYADTQASELAWRLGLERLEALAVVEVPFPGGSLELRLLGASHQAILSAGTTELSEVVACLPGTQASMPGSAQTQLSGATYDFTSQVLDLTPEELGAEVEALVERLRGNPAALVGAFPGSPHAVTALVADTDSQGVTWRTWHAYPQSGELVMTRTEVRFT